LARRTVPDGGGPDPTRVSGIGHSY
jgi:hypothetical protein